MIVIILQAVAISVGLANLMIDHTASPNLWFQVNYTDWFILCRSTLDYKLPSACEDPKWTCFNIKQGQWPGSFLLLY